MVILEDMEDMEVDEISHRKRKLAPNPMKDEGKRVKYSSFPKAASKLAVSAVSVSIPDEENNEKRKITSQLFIFRNYFVYFGSVAVSFLENIWSIFDIS